MPKYNSAGISKDLDVDSDILEFNLCEFVCGVTVAR